MNCRLCENSGIHYASNGSDDFTPECCSCPEGVRAERANAGSVLSSFRAVQESVRRLQEIIDEPIPSWFPKL